MLTGLVLENFKTFGGAHAIPLAPLTVIYGANSSGKSSILQALLFLKQNVHLGNDSTATVVVSGSHVDLGNFSQVAHRHKMTSTVTVAPLIDLPDLGQWNSGPTGPLGAPNSRHAGFGFRMGRDINGDVRVLGRPVYWSLDLAPAFVWPAAESWRAALLPYDGAINIDSPYWSWLHSKHYLAPHLRYADLKKYFSVHAAQIIDMLSERGGAALTLEEKVRDFITFSRLVRKSPTGNPDIWAAYRARHHANNDYDNFYDDTLPHADTLPSGVWLDTLEFIKGITHIGPMRKVPARIGSPAGQATKTVGNSHRSDG